MGGAFRKGDKKSLNEKNKKKEMLIRPFLKKYGKPVVVHAVNNLDSFQEIIDQKKLKLPINHKGQKKCPYMEKFLGVDNSIFLSLGFIYSVNYEFKYNLIFDLEILKQSTYYEKPLAFKCYKAIVEYWYDKDRDYLLELSNYNKNCKTVVNKYLHEKKTKSEFVGFEFWKIEKEVFKFINKYPKKKKLFKIAKKMERSLKISSIKSTKIARKDYLTHNSPEILYKKDIDLLKNPHFLGFFIDGDISSKIKRIIEKEYKNKIFLMGKDLEKLTKKKK